MNHRIAALTALLILTATHAGAQMSLQLAFPNLIFNRSVDLQAPPDGSNRLFVVEQSGRIWVFDNNPATTTRTLFLDIRDRVYDTDPETGLLGLAFHPQYADSGYFYVNYTVDTPLRTIIERYSVSADPDSALRDSTRIVIEVPQPYRNHNGGQIAFGPDGYLYIGMGDGGSSGDPDGNGQNRQNLLGAMLRIDVDTTTALANYGIPMDNPFVGNALGYREEIWAWGLRNPWRFSFDPANGRLWCGDVGQRLWEEVDIIVKEGNYGWDTMEGFHCFEPAVGCDTTGLKLPVVEYDHVIGRSITGGYVYRGTRIPELFGKYIYGDYLTGVIWSLEYDGINPTVNEVLIDTTITIPTFGVDSNNELYICSFDGKIYRFAAPGVPVTLQGYHSAWTGSSVEVSWLLHDISETVRFQVYRAEGEGSLVRLDAGRSISREGASYTFLDNDTQPGTAYRYRVVILEDGAAVTSFETRVQTPGASLSLEQNHPNPFNPSTVIPFVLERRARVQLTVYDAAGRRVIRLLDAMLPPGRHTPVWDGVDGQGQRVSSGVYFYELRAGNRLLTRKAVLVK